VIPFNGLGGADNVTGFMYVTNKIMNDYDANKFLRGHLAHIGALKI
jgi:hypothetical protein